MLSSEMILLVSSTLFMFLRFRTYSSRASKRATQSILYVRIILPGDVLRPPGLSPKYDFISTFLTRFFCSNSTVFKAPPQKLSLESNMDSATPSDGLAKLSISNQVGSSSDSNTKQGKEKKDQGKAKQQQNATGQKKTQQKANPSKSAKLRGFDKDPPEVRISKTLSWILRHGAQSEGLTMRRDGYIKLVDLVSIPLSSIEM